MTEFNDWCFDKDRKPGDYEIIQTDYGYHIMYFEGKGEETWKTQVKKDMTEENYKKQYEEMKEKYKVTVSEDYRQDIKFG